MKYILRILLLGVDMFKISFKGGMEFRIGGGGCRQGNILIPAY